MPDEPDRDMNGTATKVALAELKVWTKERMEGRDLLIKAQFDALNLQITSGLEAQEKAVKAAFQASEKAIEKAEAAQREYNVRSNEFRGQLADQANTLMPRPETMGLLKAINDRIDGQAKAVDEKTEAVTRVFVNRLESLDKDIAGLRSSRDTGTGVAKGLSTGWAVLAGMIGVALAIFAALRH